MLRAENLKKYFKEIKAVDDISFEVSRGEIFGLLGPNGAGKSTTINMLVGVLKPDSGTVHIDGDKNPMRSELRYKIGNAPQPLALYDELTAEENLQFFGKMYGLKSKKLKERASYCLELIGLTERKKSKVGTFSGGMKRRLNMACALLHDPPILLLDEPTVGVDPQSRNMIFDKIESLKKKGLCMVYTTHYMEEAQRLCDRVAIVDQGKILALDKVENLIEKYGGKSTVRIELDQPPKPDLTLPGELDGLSLIFESDNPMRQIAHLQESCLSIRTLNIERGNLENVFLKLTGRGLRD